MIEKFLIILIAILLISLIIMIILFLRERAIRKISEICVSYYEKERLNFQLNIKKQKEKISSLKKEVTALKKKGNEFFFEKIGYNRILRRYERKIFSLSKKNEWLEFLAMNFEFIKKMRTEQHTNLN